jgi:uncharacterized membrane protein
MRFMLLSFLSIWILGFLLPAISPANNFMTNFLLSKIYSTVCHQESAKCISIGGATMLVCARCSGIYAGALTASLFSLLLIVPSISLKVFMLSLIPLVIDVFFTFTGVYVYSQSLAFATGFILGNVVYLFLQSELENLFVNNLYPGNE